MTAEYCLRIGEYGAAGMFEEPDRSLFYRKALGLRRYYEHCALPKYTGKALYPSGVIQEEMCISPNYLYGLNIYSGKLKEEHPEAAEAILADFGKYTPSVPLIHTVAGDMYTHSMPNYEHVLREGLNAYRERIAKIEDRDLREGLGHLVCGIETCVKRIVSYLSGIGADEKLIKALKQVPMYPARNIYEAVVCWNFVLYLDNCDNLGCVDSGLLPFWQGEDITGLLGNLFDNLDENNGYSMALHETANPLTLQCLEAVKGKRRPMVELFVDENTPDEVWEKAFEVLRSCGGQPAFYNPHTLLCGLKEKIPSIRDIDKFCGGGCAESMIAGFSNVGSLDAGIHLLYILEQTMKETLGACADFEAFYQRYLSDVRDVIDEVTREISASQLERMKYDPLPMRTLLVDDCIDDQKDFNAGGARYKWSVINFAGLINVIDSLLVIRDWVYAEKRFTPEEFLRKLAENDTVFLKEARRHAACFGKDDPKVNAFTKQLTSAIFSMLNGKKPALGECFLPASIQFMSQVEAGKKVGATPDGREAYAPLCDSLGAIFSKDTNGPTALLNSVCALNPELLLGTPILNFNIAPSFRNPILKALILGYFRSGGVQMQLTCISAEVLEKAYRDPDSYKNLVVRVGGYSEYYCRLSDELKRMIIDRTIQGQV